MLYATSLCEVINFFLNMKMRVILCGHLLIVYLGVGVQLSTKIVEYQSLRDYTIENLLFSNQIGVLKLASFYCFLK